MLVTGEIATTIPSVRNALMVLEGTLLTAYIRAARDVATEIERGQSRIMDADYARETIELTRAQIVSQAATAMLAQANQTPQMLLELLR